MSEPVTTAVDQVMPAELAARAHRLLRTHPLFDGHNDLPFAARRTAGYQVDVGVRQPTLRTDIPRLREGGLGSQFWSAYVPCEEAADQVVIATTEQIMFIREMTQRHPEDLALAVTSQDVEAAFVDGKIASLIGLEGGHCIVDSLDVLRIYFALGARYMTLTHNQNTNWADSATDAPTHGGLAPFGVEVVAEMNRLGMLVDLSHVSAQTMHAALDVSTSPVIFSHSCCRALCEVPRNVPDDVLTRLGESGSVVMISFVPSFLSPARAEWGAELAALEASGGPGVAERWKRNNPPPPVSVHDVADHIDYARDVAGVNCIGIGSDFDGCELMPDGLEDVGAFPNLVMELMGRGYSDEELAKIIGGNLIRAMLSNEQQARGAAVDSRRTLGRGYVDGAGSADQ